MSKESPSTVSQERARERIQRAGGKVTQPRLVVFVALLDSRQALNHGDVRELLPDLDRVSLYRTLDWLLQHELVYRMTGEDGQQRYGASIQVEQHHHPHFSCVDCGATSCLPAVAGLPIQLPPGYRLQQVDIVVKGQCQECAAK